MKIMKGYKKLIIMCMVIMTEVMAQTPKAFFKAGVERMDQKEYEKAVLNFSKAIAADSLFPKAHEKRAECYTKLGVHESAMKDYAFLLKRNPQDSELKELAAASYTKAGACEPALLLLNELLSVKKKKSNLMELRAACRIATGDYKGAIEDANMVADEDKKNYEIRYLRALANDSLNNTMLAMGDYEKTIEIYEKYFAGEKSAEPGSLRKYFSAPVMLCIKNNLFEKGLKISEQGLAISSNDTELLWLRGRCFAGNQQWANAIQEYNKAIAISDRNAEFFIDRGFAFFSDSRNNEALSDFSRALTLNGKAHRAFFGRGGVESAMGMNREAMQDYEKAMLIWPGNAVYKEAYAKAQNAYREKFRENDKPELILMKPFLRKDGSLVIPNKDESYEIHGIAKDKSLIASIVINETQADFDAKSLNPEFVFTMGSGTYQNITITITDIYGNALVSRYPVLRSETDVPRIRVDIPIPKGNVLTIPDRPDYKMYLEGQVTDQSLIQTIRVNNVAASFNTRQLNPSFAVSLDVAGVEKVEIVASDEFGNSNQVNYLLNRSMNVEEQINPMGKTWVVFIENSNYQFMPSLEAVSNDIALVKNSMSGYRIDSIISRKNLSKTEMERFFSIELRNLVSKYDVASLMVWYSGHGKVSSDNGYWLPIDANKKDEYTYFPTTNLKGYLSGYKSVKHTLVVADATETGPAFYLAMRDVSPWKCGDWQATKLKSAQVLSSGESERKNENSAFSKAFAQTLQGSTDKCVTIDHVSERVSSAIQRVQKQKPRFGNIQDLGDENGTFFFIKK